MEQYISAFQRSEQEKRGKTAYFIQVGNKYCDFSLSLVRIGWCETIFCRTESIAHKGWMINIDMPSGMMRLKY